VVMHTQVAELATVSASPTWPTFPVCGSMSRDSHDLTA
jgi:hypothetical protein